jgi:Protein of unknown function (DUF4238)
MAQKKGQHLVPAVYLRSFANSDKPKGFAIDKPYSPTIWVIPKDLLEEGKRRSPTHDVFKQTRFYNLQDDNDADPLIERKLGLLETKFGKILPKIKNQCELEVEDYVHLVLFVGLLKSRVPNHLDIQQYNLNRLEEMYRMVEKSHTGVETNADTLFWMKEEGAKRRLFDHACAYAKVTASQGWIYVNTSEVPLITSDSPVIHLQLQRNELENIGISSEFISQVTTKTQSQFFSYCPLTPFLGFISSPFVIPPVNSRYRRDNSLSLVLGLNQLVRHCASNNIYSLLQHPYGDLKREIITLDSEYKAAMENIGALITTTDVRMWIPCTDIEYQKIEQPLFTRIKLYLIDSTHFQSFPIGTVLTEITCKIPGKSSVFYRGAKVIDSMINPKPYLLIETNPTLAI